MRTTHTANLYRRGASTGRTAAMRPVHGWGAALATGLPGLFQPEGRMVPAEEGKRVMIDALYFVYPDAYPEGVTPQPGDALVVTSGPRVRSTFLVHEVVPHGGGPWDDELQLVHTLESVP